MREELYHWTHRTNAKSIIRRGLLASYATGRVPLVWACRDSRALWAVGHVAEKHGWKPDDMVCFRIAPGPVKWRQTRWYGVRTTASDIPPDMIAGVKLHFLDPFIFTDLVGQSGR